MWFSGLKKNTFSRPLLCPLVTAFQCHYCSLLLLTFLTLTWFVCLAGDDESKLDDAHSLGSGAGEGYEPISDDELDEILAGDAEKREDQQEEEKMPGNALQSHRGTGVWGECALCSPP